MNTPTIVKYCAIAALVLFSAGCSGGNDVAVKQPPNVLTVSPDTAGSGDTIVVTGSGFNPVASSNRLVISQGGFSDRADRRVAVPLSGSRKRLVGVVPDGAFEGSLRVEDVDPLHGAFGFGLQPPPSPSNAVPFHTQLAAGSVGKAFFAAPSYTFTLNAGIAGADYLVVLFNSIVAPDNTWRYLYSIATQVHADLAVAASAGDGSSGERGVRAAPGPSFDERAVSLMDKRERDFKGNIRREIGDLLRRASSGQRPAGETFHSAISGPGAPPPTAQFKVLRDANESVLDPSNFITITAELRYTGTHALLYVDPEATADFLTQTDIDGFGNSFDGSIYDVDRSKFGNESDINHDGKVAVLMSPAINRLTTPGSAQSTGFIAGYFLPNDLLPALVDSRVTNGMEVFYSIVPDPTGQFGNVFPKDKTIPVIEGVLAHEFCHMIIFNYRVLIYGQGFRADYMEELWMNEGLAHIAEDLNGFKQSNIARANLFLAEPGDVTLIYGGDELKERGASFLFLRHLGDRFGDGIYKSLVQSKLAGVRNVEAATNAFFKELFADWSAACYLSGRGITSDSRFNYSSINLLSDFKPLYVITGSLSAGSMSRSIKAMAPEYILYSLPSEASVTFTIGSDPTGKMNAIVVRIR